MTIENKKLDLIHWLSSLTDENTIQKLYEVKEKNTEDWYYKLSSKEKKSINSALEELKAGEVFTNEEVKQTVRLRINELKNQ